MHPRNQCYERANRVSAVYERLESEGILSKVRTLPSCSIQPPSPELLLALSRVHDEEYISKILDSGRTESVGEARRADLNMQPDIFVTPETAR